MVVFLSFFFFIINSTQLEQNEKDTSTHQEITIAYHKIYSIHYSERSKAEYLKKKKDPNKKSGQLERCGKMKTQ